MLFSTIFAIIYTMTGSFSDAYQMNNCSEVHLQTNPMVNLTEYFRASWYVQQQQVNGYQSLDELYCVVATYDLNNHTHVPFFSGDVVSVFNYANSGRVNGPPMGYIRPGTNGSFSNMTSLCGRVYNRSQPERLAVAPCFLPNLFAGPYWILSAGPSPSHYEWAIVIGGQPTVQMENHTCTTAESGINGSGLWLFSRNQTLRHVDLMYLHRVLEYHNVSTSLLHNVSQSGCNYTGAYLKH